jgi:hypothetical protein
MLEARIESPKGSLYFAAEATPYDLEMLQLYVRDLTPADAQDALKLEVTMDDKDPTAPFVAEWLGHLAATGVRVACSRASRAR